MKRKRGAYYVGDRVMDRAWKKEGTVVRVPEKFTSLSRLDVDWDGRGVSETWAPSIMLTRSFLEGLVKKMNANYWLPEVGDRVKIPSVGIKGTVQFVAMNDIYRHHNQPIQVALDEPYDDSGHMMLRTNLKDCKKLKPKEKTKKKKDKVVKTKAPAVLPDDDLLWDDEEMEWD